MKLEYYILLFILPLICLLSGCDKIHEFPEPGQEIDPTIVDNKVIIKTLLRISEYSVVTKNAVAAVPAGEQASDYDRRYIINFRTNEYVDSLIESHIVTRDSDDTSSIEIETELHARKYKAVVWMDYVRKGTIEDLYYLTSNGTALDAIHLPAASQYTTGSDYKDAQTYMGEIDLTSHADEWFSRDTLYMPLTRPLAKITILTNDLAKYAESVGYVGDLSELAAGLKFKFTYDGYFPSGFNANTGRLNDAETGYGFTSSASYPYTLEDENYARIAFDYVFVNGESSSVTITVASYTKDGEFINEIRNFQVPIYMGKETVVIYKFLSKEEYVPGIGIDPGFDGEFNIYV